MKEISEHIHQRDLIEWCNMTAWRDPSKIELTYIFAIPNGGLRNKAVAARLKTEGVKAGVPDLFLPVARFGRHGLFIEMKKDKGRQSKKQKEWEDILKDQGYGYAICYSFEEAKSVLLHYLIDNP